MLQRKLHCLLVSLIFLFIFSLNAQDQVLVRMDISHKISEANLPVYACLQDLSGKEYVLVIETLTNLEKSKRSYQILDFISKKLKEETYFLALNKKEEGRKKAGLFVTILHDDGKQLVVRAKPEDAESLCMFGFEIAELGNEPMIFAESKPESTRVEYHPAIEQIIGAVQKETLFQYTGNLSGENAVTIGGNSYKIVSRYTKSGEPIAKATQYVSEFMEKQGASVSYHDWSNWGTSGRNVIGQKKGSTKPEEIVLITAHLDSMPSSSTNSPGADDNGSGSAAVMLACQIFSKYKFERTLRFVFFTGEEQGLYGSKAYADKVYQAGDKIVAVYNMDMIAWDTIGLPTLRIHTRTTSSSGYQADKAIADIFANIVSTYKLNLTTIIDPDGIAYSDHASLWKKGYPGVLAIEDDEDDFCGNYHTSRDKLATLNMDYFTQYVKASLATAAHLAVPKN